MKERFEKPPNQSDYGEYDMSGFMKELKKRSSEMKHVTLVTTAPTQKPVDETMSTATTEMKPADFFIGIKGDSIDPDGEYHVSKTKSRQADIDSE